MVSMLYDSQGVPIRNVKEIAEEVSRKNIEYEIVPENEMDSPPASHSNSYKNDKLRIGNVWHDVIYLTESKIQISENSPKRFRPILAAHEYGHKLGLTHPEIFVLEMKAADVHGEANKDSNLKYDYLRWSASDEHFQHMKKHLGLEKENTLRDIPEIEYSNMINLYKSANPNFKPVGIVRKTGENTFQLYPLF